MTESVSKHLLKRRAGVWARLQRILLVAMIVYGFFWILDFLSRGAEDNRSVFALAVDDSFAIGILAGFAALVVAVHIVLWTMGRVSLPAHEVAGHAYIPGWVAWMCGSGTALVGIGNAVTALSRGNFGVNQFAIAIFAGCLTLLVADSFSLVAPSTERMMDRAVAIQRRRQLRIARSAWPVHGPIRLASRLKDYTMVAGVSVAPAATLLVSSGKRNLDAFLAVGAVGMLITVIFMELVQWTFTAWVVGDWDDLLILLLGGFFLSLLVFLVSLRLLLEPAGGAGGASWLLASTAMLMTAPAMTLAALLFGRGTGRGARALPSSPAQRIGWRVRRRIRTLNSQLLGVAGTANRNEVSARLSLWHAKTTGRGRTVNCR